MIDLHLHTNHSDGTDSVKELLENAEKQKLDIISITDHNSVSAYFELEENPEIRKIYSGEIIIGSEIKAIFDDINIEILAYGIDYKKINIKKEDKLQVQTDILKHYINVAKNLGIKVDEDIKIDTKDPTKIFACWVFYDNITKYKENEKILNELGPINRTTFYRDHEGNINSPFYYNTSKYYDDIKTLIDKIHGCGGLAFLAHGLLYPFNNKEEAIEKILKTTPIDGLECIYPLFNKKDTDFMINLCQKYQKLMSGGSDYHAKNKPTISMGTGIDNNISIQKTFVKDWVNKVRKI
ncbi:MAG: PHP domain-containing protein [Bacilli bacterium]|nr:PHP domain-containing protein [Bacilli bacterium]